MIRGLDFIRSIPDFGARLYEALKDLDSQHGTLAQQVNGNGQANPNAPPPINSLQVAAQNGHFQIRIVDNGAIYRGVQYYVEHADNPHFTNPHVIHLGDSRNHSIFLGSATRYFRAYSSYASSPAGQPVYFGGAQPIPVAGGGSVGPPAFLQSEGSGTGGTGVGLQGPGIAPFRSSDGSPPSRG